jgi:ADP-ribose pyrophosphatase
MIQPWKRVEPTTVHKVGFRTIVTKTFELPEGKQATCDSIGPEGLTFVTVIALTKDKKVIIARQFRFGPEKVMDDLPGGGVDKGESLEMAVRRELQEETGYRPETLAYLGVCYRGAYSNNPTHYFLATGCEQIAGQHLDPEEIIEVELITIDQLIYNARHGRMVDAGGVLLAYEKLIEMKEGTHAQSS